MEPNQFSGLRVPRVPPGLRERALRGASTDDAPGVWDRLWESRPLRLAWILTCSALLLAHAALSLSPEDSHENGRAAMRDQNREVRRMLALPRIEISPRARALTMGSSRANDSKPNTIIPKNEVKS